MVRGIYILAHVGPVALEHCVSIDINRAYLKVSVTLHAARRELQSLMAGWVESFAG